MDNGNRPVRSGQEKEEDVDLNMLFSLRKPQHVGAGIVSAAKSVGKGVLAGAVGLVAAPAVGASQEGFKGFAKGAAVGIAGAVLLPATGVAVGAAQVVRGIANTPEAIREQNKGKQWDRKTRVWIDDPGTALIVDDGTFDHLRPVPSATVEDYYGLLGVARDVTAEEIKRAYYLAARRLHPDKNPDDPAAHERFQALAQAYQVLGNEELRKRYDAHGSQGLDVNFVDGAEFFTALFGSDRFEHLVGELMLAAAARAGPSITAEGIRRLQTSREATLAAYLSSLLQQYVQGDEIGFRKSMEAEAQDLAGVSGGFGHSMLRTVGKVYETQASIELGGMFEGGLVALRAQGRSIKSQFKAAKLAIKVMQAQQNIGRLEAEAERAQRIAEEYRERQSAGIIPSIDGQPDDDVILDPAQLTAAATAAQAERVKAEEASLPIMLDAMWAANVLDIESTLRRVCRTVLKDPGASKAHRRRLAEGLLELGLIFKAAGISGAEGSSEQAPSAKDRVEEAMLRVAEKRMQGAP